MHYKIHEAIDRLKCLIWGHVHEEDITYEITSCHFCDCLMSEYGDEIEDLPFALNLQRLFYPLHGLRHWYDNQFDNDDIPF